ncbi:hypothetical protein W97_08596 [Coniosporium apollinis CBS 100218]|uniref:Uncharacterized protein n=1 Tax=Coniosporium apollinis (strain CBS 100218) TaxID=1168221 RepID=R7Z5X9_CONA1|nr:uncharacterized protein W97_08596 [Coniosporium apollinis CBS 100218]EON69336.1 hypothetical protein W97_08596 [Coniosporium apollinis CBS 100218]
MPKHILYIKKYNARDCLLAIRGEQIPQALGLDVTRLCVVRGICYHPGFAKELHGSLPEFIRALNARSIMSNEIPDMKEPDEIPYCIWHPQTATEATYRELAHRYPQMKYQIGRACAVAGYLNLYGELGLLPEVHIAEEARDNGQSAILDAIMAAGTKYAAMNDYTRTVEMDQPTMAHLNGDTAVRSYLDIRQRYTKPSLSLNSFSLGYKTHYFDITEDWRIDEYESDEPILREDVTPLLYTPLPADLPNVNKDLLILMAAYYGNIDRYARLRRPMRVPTEFHCIVRGVYHNTMFAKWWSLQPTIDDYRIQCAINARFIMNNDLSRISPDTRDSVLPYCIWYPAVADWRTYMELARRKPSMKQSVARACIVADYKTVYDGLNAEPDSSLMAEARDSPNPHYLRDLERKAAERGGVVSDNSPEWKRNTRKQMFEPTTTWLNKDVSNFFAETEFSWAYDGVVANMSFVELNVCAPDELKQKDFVDLGELYEPWHGF